MTPKAGYVATSESAFGCDGTTPGQDQRPAAPGTAWSPVKGGPQFPGRMAHRGKTGSLHTALNNTVLRKHGFIMPSDLAATM